MTTQNHCVGATSHETMDWHSIDWQKAHRNVRRLQARIVKATQEGRWGKVKALQRLLTHSFSGKALAVKRVTENQGKRTAGVDGAIWDTPQKKATAVQALRQRGYRPRPLRRVYIPKKNGKMRPLGIPTMQDRAMQALYLLALDPIAETTGDENSYGFRPERSAADAIAQCHTILHGSHGAEWILEADIQSCFDRISHDWLMAHIPIDKAILQKWLKAGFMEQHVLYPTEQGTPQGGIISPVLANLTLDGLEKELRRAFPKKNQKQQQKVNLVRYADDFIITGRTKSVLEDEVMPLVKRFLAERELELSLEKTKITHIQDGFDFLGKNIRKYNRVILTKPSQKSVRTFLKKVREIIKANLTLNAGRLVVTLNPLIRGWAQYYQHDAAKVTFSKIDYAIFQALWRWAKRRHPNKSARWIARKYFWGIPGRTWTFHGETFGKMRTLIPMDSTPVTRYVKVRMKANPYDPAWEMYFEERLGLKMDRTLIGRKRLLYLWKEQHGICPVCEQKITTLTSWHNHHIVWKSLGGSERTENRVLLHPNCHHLVHSRKLTVEKPRPAKGV